MDSVDPQAIQELQRTLTQQSTTRHSSERLATVESKSSVYSTVVDHTTGIPTPTSQGSKGFDLEKQLQYYMQRHDEHSIQQRTLGVVFYDLNVQGLGSAASAQPTLGSVLNPLNVPEMVRLKRHPPVRSILSGFEGVVKPGEMLLVLGRPGAGCTTFLKTLANQHDEFHSVSGLLRYSTFTPDDIRKQFRGDVIYCPEDDVHFPTLTVQETLNFAAKTRTPDKGARVKGVTRQSYANSLTGLLETVFGLQHVKDTKVGDAAVRGVSGGERKRVSIAEALATRAKVGSWDNSTRGLDSSTALEFVRALRIATDNLHMTSIVSIYQASELLYSLFDKVCVIYEGRMVYFGPADTARAYFTEMGWEAPMRQTTADFLVSVTDPNGRSPRPGFEHRVPRSADEFAEWFRQTPLSLANRGEIFTYLTEMGHDIPRSLLETNQRSARSSRSTYVEKARITSAYVESARAEHARHTLERSSYTISVPMQVRAVIQRRIQIMKGSWLTLAVQITSYTFQGIIISTLFLRAPINTNAFFSRGGVLFFSLFFGALSAFSEMPALFSQRPIILRHQKAAMYHPFTEAIAFTLVDIPVTFTQAMLFSIVLYFIVQFQQSAGQFFTFFLFIFGSTLTMKGFFRAIASAFKKQASAISLAGICILALILYTGYAIPEPSMIPALRWIRDINPLRYAFEAVVANEFHTINGTCGTLVPRGPGYENITIANQVCATIGALPGEDFVDGNAFIKLSYGYSFQHIWRNFGIMSCFAVGFFILFNIFTEWNTIPADQRTVTLFKRGSSSVPASTPKADDEEHQSSNVQDVVELSRTPSTSEFSEKKPVVMSETFTWQHVSYTVPIGGGHAKKLLDDISGYVSPGKLTALMGASGAGKTTLLNVLAQRVDVGVVSGDILVNGHPLPRDFQAQTGYCQQSDTHVDRTTVREALEFSANLRQPRTVPGSEKKAYVNTCLKMCGLERYADAIVGSLGVELRKRTTIGVELAAKPRLLLFLDEPTSGLDSQSAWAIVSFLRSLAQQGQAILCTIHQPSSQLFEVFDRLLLLQKGGQTVYFGDLGPRCSTIIKYFEKNGARECGNQENPAEWMLEVVGAGATAESSIEWSRVWKMSAECARLKSDLLTIESEGRRSSASQSVIKDTYATSWAHQLYFLLKRGFICYWRNPSYLIAKFVLNIVAGLFVGFTFFKAGDSLQDTQNKIFAVFISMFLAAPLSNQVIGVFHDNRSVFEIRERPSRMYSVSALIVSLVLVEMPWNILGSFLYLFCWYWTVGFDSARAGYTWLTYGVVFPLYYTTLAHAVASMSPNHAIASIVFTTAFSFVVAFDGVLQPFRSLNWWKWMYRASPFTYLIEGLTAQAVGGKLVNCSPTEFVTIHPPDGQSCGEFMSSYISMAGGYLTNSDATSNCQFCEARTTDEYLLANFNLKYGLHWRDFGIFVAASLFNFSLIFLLFYIFRIRKRSVLRSIKDAFARSRNSH
ncbi:hypothetical protein SCHPADRAFT_826595 [Schizopora paradoxa]|uniref:ABC transporter domain-containing protein n=1 Tax=Schizopora paradoxa TaxID=27342 RepID=A0A0H2RXX1_9AGAM|nr:hypothetical protein SCHPADRAFT_826595 [Schizopora paradoxa]